MPGQPATETPLTVTLEIAELEKAFHESALRTSAYLDCTAIAKGTNHKPASEQYPPDLWRRTNEPPKTYQVPSNGTQAYLGPDRDRVGTVALGEVPSVDWLRSEAAKESPRDPCYPSSSRPLGGNAAADASRAAPVGRSPRETTFFAREPTPGHAQAPSWLGSIMSLLTPRGADGAGVTNAPADNGKPPAGRGNTTADNGVGHDAISSSFAWVPNVPVSAVARGTGMSCTALNTRTQRHNHTNLNPDPKPTLALCSPHARSDTITLSHTGVDVKEEEARAKARALVIDARARAAEMGQGGDKEHALPTMAALPPTKDAVQSESLPAGHSLQVQQEYGPFEDMHEFRTLTQSQVRACEHTHSLSLSHARTHARARAHTHTPLAC